jgi:CBS domain-containing protein
MKAQLIGTAAALAYGLVAGVILFTVIKATVGLRVSEDEELAGLDLAEHGVAAYPELVSETGTGLHVLSAVRVDEVMTQVPAVAPQDSLEAVQEIMFSCEVFALPVLSEDGDLCGIISMSDVTKIARSERVGDDRPRQTTRRFRWDARSDTWTEAK